nr:iron-containing alcohol dehydrogenase [Lachnospiraceae bacterium]
GCAAVHALSYPLGAVHHIPHGQSNQLMFAEVMRKYKSLATEGRLLELEEILAGCLRVAPEQSLEALCELMDQILKREPLAAFGVKEEELPEFAADVIKTQQRLLKNNLIPLSEEDILDIYRAAYEMLP